jgi:PAS domain S-box-containing protein
MLKRKMNIKNHKPQKLQLKLTLKFALFFIIVSGLIYWHFSDKFEDDVLEIYRYKAKSISNYLEQIPETFWHKEIKEKDKVWDLMVLNEASYVVLEDNQGMIIDALNIEYAEKQLYINSATTEDISFSNSIYKVVQPIFAQQRKIGQVYVGFNSTEVATDLKSKTLLTALFSLSILLFGIVFTYFLSSISFKPILKLISALERKNRNESRAILNDFKNDEVGILAQKINGILTELDHSSFEVENLNKKLQEAFREKIYELDVEINQRKKAETYLKRSEEHFKLLFENAPIGMVIISIKGIIVNVNNAFCRTVGYDLDEILGLPLNCLFEGDNSSVMDSNQLLNSLRQMDSECVLVRKDRNKIDAVVKSITLMDENNEPSNYMMQLLDITDIKQAQKDLTAALDKAQESDRLKSAFLAQMSHEIRTPLNVILTSVPILADDIGDVDEEIKTVLYSVGSAGRRLHRTIDMILSMSAIQSGNYEPEYESFDLSEEVKNLTEEFRTLTDDKGLSLEFKNNTGSSDIIADKYTVNQIFQNLLGNAVKYTHKGFIKVIIEDAEIESTENDKVLVRVIDSGIGMSKNYIDEIFSPFSQEDVGQKRNYEGNGLGLALVKKYVDVNRASISVSSEKNEGSEFRVVFEKKLHLGSLEERQLMMQEVRSLKS